MGRPESKNPWCQKKTKKIIGQTKTLLLDDCVKKDFSISDRKGKRKRDQEILDWKNALKDGKE